jgi:Zn-dependent metalloprotease
VAVLIVNEFLCSFETIIDDIEVKCIDAPQQDLPFNTLKTHSGSLIDIRANAIFGEYVSKELKKDSSLSRVQHQLEPLNPVDIHFLTCQYIEFLKTELKIESPTESKIVLSVHRIPNLENAYFTGTHMVYGLGGKNMLPMGKADVVGHELGHSIVSMLSGLVYRGESGALNEHFADVLGVVFEFWLYKKFNEDEDKTNDLRGESDWLIGEDVMKHKPFMRSFSDPNLGLQPKIYGGKFWVDPKDLNNDLGGVHINSGVGNYCFYLVSQKMDIYDACRLWIKTLRCLSPDSKYSDFARVLKACSNEDEIGIIKESLTIVNL